MSNYSIDGRNIISDKGRIVATLDSDGNPIMAPGMAGPHSKGVKEFLETFAENEPLRSGEPETIPESSELPEVKAEAENDLAPAEDPAEDAADRLDWAVSTIPEDSLPPFSKELGVNTPGFAEFVKHHKLTPLQAAVLVKRLSD